MSQFIAPTATGHSIDDVWAAAVWADQVNQGYVKTAEHRWNPELEQSELVRDTNRVIMFAALADPTSITDDLRAAGRKLREQLAQDLTLRTLKGTTNDFDRSVGQVLAVTDCFVPSRHRYELAVLPCLPTVARRSQHRADRDAVLRQCDKLTAVPGTKVTLKVRVLSTFYSQNYHVYFVTAVTQDQQAVMFSYKNNIDADTVLEIRGTVREHCAQHTRLNRVKVI